MFSASAIVPGEDTVANEQMDFAISEGLILDKNLSTEEQLRIISNSKILSDEQKLQAVEKINFVKQANKLKLDEITPLYNTTFNFTVEIPYFKQKNSYYCGPATTKQSLHYINGVSPSQDVIANSLGTTTAGTDGANIVTYMNANQNYIYYMAITPSAEAGMANMIYHGLTVYGTAPILRLKMTTAQGWPYGSAGHFMNVSGQYTVNGAVQYEVTDPYIQYVNQSETDGKYRISSVAVYNSTRNHFAQQFYY